MVRQSEVAKNRRTNMSHSSINAPPKKGGAGGSFTWGAPEDVVDYLLVGFDANTIGITAAPAPNEEAICKTPAPLACNLSLDDKEQFPALAPSSMTPAKVSKASSEDESQVELTAEETQDWVLLSAADANAKVTENCKSPDLYDSQHPRNTFTKKTQTKRSKSTERRQAPEIDIDWSKAGMPTEVTKQILHASMTASHRGPYAKEQGSQVPANVLRSQNRSSSSKRQNSEPRTPRSQSKPRAIHQPAGRR